MHRQHDHCDNNELSELSVLRYKEQDAHVFVEADAEWYLLKAFRTALSRPRGYLCGRAAAALLDATGILTDAMQMIAREFNFGEAIFVPPKNYPRGRVGCVCSRRAEVDVAGHPSVCATCALVMKQHVRLGA